VIDLGHVPLLIQIKLYSVNLSYVWNMLSLTFAFCICMVSVLLVGCFLVFMRDSRNCCSVS